MLLSFIRFYGREYKIGGNQNKKLLPFEKNK